MSDVTEVFSVQRDLITELQNELKDQKMDWADEIVRRVVAEVNDSIANRVMLEVEPDKIWEDLTDKEYRLTIIEENWATGDQEGDPSRARTDEGTTRSKDELEKRWHLWKNR